MKPLTIKIGDLTFETFTNAVNPKAVEAVWYWHCKAANGELVCTSGENFASKGNAERAMKDFIESVRVPNEPEGPSDY